MPTHSNILQVKLELLTIGVGLPVAGLVASVILWLRLRAKSDGNGFAETHVGFRLIALSFGAYLIWLRLTSLHGHRDASFTALVLILLSFSGAIAACSGLVLTAFNARGPFRISGAVLSLVALAYAIVSGFALLTGRVA